MLLLTTALAQGAEADALGPAQTQATRAGEMQPIVLGLLEGLSGAFADAGAAVHRNLEFAVEAINARGGVSLPDGRHRLALEVYDTQGKTEQALVELRRATDDGLHFILEGNSSAVAGALVEAIERNNRRRPDERVVFLNYSADDPALTNARCSFWHFRFDANSDMRMKALTDLLALDASAHKVYLINQDYVFGRGVARAARLMLAQKRPDIQIVGDSLHPLAAVRDFAPYIANIRSSGADAVITGNWGSDLTLLVRAAREGGLDARFFTFYGNGLGAPAAFGEAGVDRVFAVTEWQPNSPGPAGTETVEAFRLRYPAPRDQYQIFRLQMMLEMLTTAISKAGSTDATKVAASLEGMKFSNGFHEAIMRTQDHQLLQSLDVSVMQRVGSPGVAYDQEGSGYGFRTRLNLPAERTALPSNCVMQRP